MTPVSNTPSVPPGTRVVWKFAVPMPTPTGRAFIDVPSFAECLSVGIQDDEIVVWALVVPPRTGDALSMRRLIVANTGMAIPDFPEGARFLGTATSSNGIVWHVWDSDA